MRARVCVCVRERERESVCVCGGGYGCVCLRVLLFELKFWWRAVLELSRTRYKTRRFNSFLF